MQRNAKARRGIPRRALLPLRGVFDYFRSAGRQIQQCVVEYSLTTWVMAALFDTDDTDFAGAAQAAPATETAKAAARTKRIRNPSV